MLAAETQPQGLQLRATGNPLRIANFTAQL